MRIYTIPFYADTNETDQERFSLIYQGFLMGGNSPQKGMEVIRREAKILDKLEEISGPEEGSTCDSCGIAKNPSQKLHLGAQYLRLEQPEMTLLTKYIEQTPWNTRSSRKVRDLVDWLASIKAEETPAAG